MSYKWTATANGGTDANYVGIPTSILKLHTNDLLFEAMPVMRYDQFAVVKTDLMAEPGDTISFNKYANLDRGGVILEDADLQTKSMSKSVIPISVTEYGNAVGLTAKFLTLSFMDEMQNASVLLGRDYAIVTDMMLRDAATSTTQKYYCGAVSEQKDITSAGLVKLDDIDSVVEVLATGSVLKYVDANGEYYVGFFHPHQTKNIKKELLPVRQYAYPELIFKGEVGEYNGVRFIETANVLNGADANTLPQYDATLIQGYTYASGKSNAVALYKGVIFGERSYGWAIALPVELREDPGFQSFGRKRGLAWYAIMGAAKINNENAVLVYSA
jgi:N4-gp56 family major capsid protein